MNPLISVIVPIYKVENYLAKCIESILNQTYTNLEILLIDDGSPDNCGIICDEFAKKDNRIKAIHKENGGLSDARNAGLSAVNGEYVTFVDSDDFIDKEYISSLYSLIGKYKTQIAVTLFRHITQMSEEKKISEEYYDKSLSKTEALNTMFYQKLFDNNATAKLYHISLFKTIRFPINLLYEDLITTYKVFMATENGVAFSNTQTYNYLLRDDSIEGSPFSEKKFNSLNFIIEDLEKTKSENPNLTQCINCRVVSLLFHLLFETKRGSYYEKEIFKIIYKYRINVILNSNARKKTRIAAIMSFFGSDFLRFFYKFGKSRN